MLQKRKQKGFLVCVLCYLLCCCGCQTEKGNVTEEGTMLLPKDTTIPVSAAFQNSESTAKARRFENDFVRIWRSEPNIYYDENGTVDSPCTWQENLDGTGREMIDQEEGSYLLWLTDDWCYYSVHDDKKDRDILYRATVDNENVPIFNMEQAEQLFSVKNLCRLDFVVTDHCILYSEYDEEYGTANVFYQYDFKTKEITRAFALKKGAEVRVMQKFASYVPVTLENTFFVLENSRNLYRVSFDTWKKKKIYSGKLTNHDFMVEYNGAVYFVPGKDQILKYDGSSGEISCVLDQETFQNILEKMNLWEENGIDKDGEMGALYTFQDRLYMVVDLSWYQKERVSDGPAKGKVVKCEHSRQILISTELTDLGQWELEKKLMDYISEHAAQDLCWRNASEKTALYRVEQLAHIYFIDRGVVLFDINTDAPAVRLEEVFFDMMSYDMTSGEIKKLDDMDYRNLYTRWDYY